VWVGCRFISEINGNFQNEGWARQDVWVHVLTVPRLCFCASLASQTHFTEPPASSVCVRAWSVHEVISKSACDLTHHTHLLTPHRKVGGHARIAFLQWKSSVLSLPENKPSVGFCCVLSLVLLLLLFAGGIEEGQAFLKHNWGGIWKL